MNSVLWTNKAKKSYEEKIDFLLSNWGINATIRFENKVNQLTSQLKQYKFLCPASSQEPSIRRCTINKQISMTYQIVDTVIFILSFYDNRSQHDYT